MKWQTGQSYLSWLQDGVPELYKSTESHVASGTWHGGKFEFSPESINRLYIVKSIISTDITILEKHYTCIQEYTLVGKVIEHFRVFH